MNEITPQLHITDEQTVRDLPDNTSEFDEIVTVGYSRHRDSPPTASDTGDEFYFPDGNHEYADFKRASDYVIEQLENGETVLVHCQAGVSRSAGICSVALTETTELTLDEALEKVTESRPMVNPAEEIRNSMQQYTDQTILPEYGENTALSNQIDETE